MPGGKSQICFTDLGVKIGFMGVEEENKKVRLGVTLHWSVINWSIW